MVEEKTFFGKLQETGKRLVRDLTTKRMYRKKGIRQYSPSDYIQKRYIQATYGKTPKYILRREKVMKKMAQQVVPVQSYTETGKVFGSPGRRGRPKGSLDPRYAAYGGVYGYRKWLSQQKTLARMALMQQKQQMKMQNMPQYETQQYSPQETQVQTRISPAELQAIQLAEQMQASNIRIPQQQYPSQPIRRPIPTVFKGNGGKPYPAVDTTPLASSKQTVPMGYVEVVDMFSGRRYLKPLPKPERWSS